MIGKENEKTILSRTPLDPFLIEIAQYVCYRQLVTI
jgi:hypothetical protein